MWVQELLIDETLMKSQMLIQQLNCDYEGCVNGHVHCCDGLVVNEPAD